MQGYLLDLLRCPVTRSDLTITVIKKAIKILDNKEVEIIEEAVLFAADYWFYPVIKGVPRLNVEAIIDYAVFLKTFVPDYAERKERLLLKYGAFIKLAEQKNRRTKESFTQEWILHNHEEDKTWNADAAGMLNRFLTETNETLDTLAGKIIFDAGCGNGILNSLLAQNGIANIAMDFSDSIEKAYFKNKFSKVHFIQGDVQFPPLLFNYFDIVHSSGVLIHTNNTELSFSCIEQTVKTGGKLSVWLYHKRSDSIHNLFNAVRKVTSRLPLKLQYYLYRCTIFPISFIIKRIKGNKQNTREMMVDILDWFTPEFRWEHDHEEAAAWFYKRNYYKVGITTDGVFGFNITGEKKTK
jgi:SAM-dependent methyltransferase/uncharacterized protein YbaR (Trm112 family)